MSWLTQYRDAKGRWAKEPIKLNPLSGANIDWEKFDITQPFSFPLSSSCVAVAAYNPLASELELEFTDGSNYTYYNVPQWVVLDLVKSSSAGRYFNYQIRDQYSFDRS